jgi:hypothetical protein
MNVVDTGEIAAQAIRHFTREVACQYHHASNIYETSNAPTGIHHSLDKQLQPEYIKYRHGHYEALQGALTGRQEHTEQPPATRAR